MIKEAIDDVYTVYHCNWYYKEIMDAIKNGACSVEEIMKQTTAGTACGLCKLVKNDPAAKKEQYI